MARYPISGALTVSLKKSYDIGSHASSGSLL